MKKAAADIPTVPDVLGILCAVVLVLCPAVALAQPAKAPAGPSGWKTDVEPAAQGKSRKRARRGGVQQGGAAEAPTLSPQQSVAEAAPKAVAAEKPEAQPAVEAEAEAAAGVATPAVAETTETPEKPAPVAPSNESPIGRETTATDATAAGSQPSPHGEGSSQQAPNAQKSDESKTQPADTRRTTSYCLNIANQALDARYLLQKKRLDDLKVDIQTRTAALEAKIGELRDWYKKREDFVKKARTNLVGIYASMKADAAAKQLSEIDEETASALLTEIDARQSSAILSEMDSKKAARLTGIMAGAVEVETPAPKKASPDANGKAEDVRK